MFANSMKSTATTWLRLSDPRALTKLLAAPSPIRRFPISGVSIVSSRLFAAPP